MLPLKKQKKNSMMTLPLISFGFKVFILRLRKVCEFDPPKDITPLAVPLLSTSSGSDSCSFIVFLRKSPFKVFHFALVNYVCI